MKKERREVVEQGRKTDVYKLENGCIYKITFWKEEKKKVNNSVYKLNVSLWDLIAGIKINSLQDIFENKYYKAVKIY